MTKPFPVHLTFLGIILFAALVVACDGAQSMPPVDQERVDSAADWLVSTHQNADGGYTSFSQGADQAASDVNQTLDVIIGLAATGSDPAEPRGDASASPVGYLEANAPALAEYAAGNNAQAGKAIMAIVAAGEDPASFAGRNLVNELTAISVDVAALPAADPTSLSLTILGLVSADAPVPETLVTALIALQDQQSGGELAGSWDDGYGTAGNADATAMAIMALVAADSPEATDSLKAAQAFLLEVQDASGGFAYAPGFPTSANSTALVVQALHALGEPYWEDDGTWARAGGTPLDALLAFQSASGAFQADFGGGPSDDFFATVQSLPAAAGVTLPPPAWSETGS
jgi:hypothetical protein